jgi:integrase/recombinase XerD
MSKRKAPANTYWRGPVLWAKVSVKGQTYRQSLRTDDPAVARRRVEEFRRELTGRAHFSEANRSFDEVMAAWGQGIADRVSKTTAKRYLCSLGQLEPFLAGKTLADVKGELLTEIINGRRSTGATIATIKRDLVALSSVMGFAIDEGWIESNPVLPRLGRLKERRDPIALPDPAHIENVIQAAPRGLASLIHAAWKTGCRQAELAKAKRIHFSQERRQLTVVGKRNKMRTIDLSPEAAGALSAAASGSEWLFVSEAGDRHRNAAASFHRLVQRQVGQGGVTPFRFHDLRHRFAVDYLKAGGSIYVLQQHLGHDSVKTTEVYLKYLSPAEQLTAKFGAAMGTKSGTAVFALDIIEGK